MIYPLYHLYPCPSIPAVTTLMPMSMSSRSFLSILKQTGLVREVAAFLSPLTWADPDGVCSYGWGIHFVKSKSQFFISDSFKKSYRAIYIYILILVFFLTFLRYTSNDPFNENVHCNDIVLGMISLRHILVLL